MFKALFSARGRMRRRDWWLWSIVLLIFVVCTEWLAHTFFGAGTFREDLARFKGPPSNNFQWWLTFAVFIYQWPWVCLYAKRWHDRNRSGWLAALAPAINLANWLIAHFATLGDDYNIRFVVGVIQGGLGILNVLYALWVLIDCGILDGTQGPNKYGPSPKGVGVTPADVF